MADKKLLDMVEKNLIKINKQIAKLNGDIGAHKMNSFAKLLNAYNRMAINAASKEQQPKESYYEMMERGEIRMKGR